MKKNLISAGVVFLLLIAVLFISRRLIWQQTTEPVTTETAVPDADEYDADAKVDPKVRSDVIAAESEPAETPPPEPLPVNKKTLCYQELNPDCVGYLIIAGEEYPLMWSGDNETYLYTCFDGTEGYPGTLFLDGDSDGTFHSKHQCIWGHHMSTSWCARHNSGGYGRIFSNFTSRAYFEKNTQIIIGDENYEYLLRPVAVSVLAKYPDDEPGDNSNAARMCRTRFISDWGFRHFTKELVANASYITEDFNPATCGALVSFGTCSYGSEDEKTFLTAEIIDKYEYR